MEFFKVCELVTNLPARLVSAAATSDRIYVGTSEGTVLEYAAERDKDGKIVVWGKKYPLLEFFLFSVDKLN